MSAYEPGQVAILSIGGESVRGIVRDDEWMIVGHRFYRSIRVGNGTLIQDVRPLVVLDLDDWEHKIELLRQDGSISLREIADAIEAQTKKPRMNEPGRYGVVRDVHGYDWVRSGTIPYTSREWVNQENGRSADWADIERPTWVRDGIEESS